MARKNGRGMKAKGDKFERELAAHINQVFQHTREGTELCHRAPLSGGGVINHMHGGADLTGPPALHVEAKRVERLSFPDAMKQAEASLAKSGSQEVPIVINRRNRQAIGESYALMRLDHFLIFYSFFLERLGHVRSFEASAARDYLTGQTPMPGQLPQPLALTQDTDDDDDPTI